MDKVRTKKFRLSFPNLFKARDFQGDGKFKFGITMLFDKKTEKEDLKELRAMAAAAWKELLTKSGKKLKMTKNPFHDGDVEKSELDGYPGNIFITASSRNQVVPVKRDPATNALIPCTEQEIYPGCFCKAVLHCYAFNKGSNIGVAFGLDGVLKVGDGPSLTGRMSPEQAFEVIEDDDFIKEIADDDFLGGKPAATPTEDDDIIF